MKSRLYRALLVGRFFAFATFTINLASWNPKPPLLLSWQDRGIGVIIRAFDKERMGARIRAISLKNRLCWELAGKAVFYFIVMV